MGMNALEVRRRVILAQPHEAVAVGAVASFRTDVLSPLKMSFDLLPIQAGTGDPSPENVRPITGHDGFTVYDDPKYGGLIWWNQLVQNGNFANSSYWNYNAVSLSFADNKVTATKTSAVTSSSIYQNGLNITGNHKYLFSAVITPSANTTQTRFRIYKDSTDNKYVNSNSISANTRTVVSAITDIGWTTSNGRVYLYFDQDSSANDTSFVVENFQIFDLTEMFGAGNEPSTVAEFRALFPLDYYAYNSGETTCVSAVSNLPYTKRETEFPTPPGTVYGGHVTDNGDGTCDLTVNTAIYTFDGTNNAVNAMSDIGTYKFFSKTNFVVPAPNTTVSNDPPTLWCDTFKAKGAGGLGTAFISGSYFRICADPSFTSVEAFNTWLQSNNVTFIYKLNNPVTYTLPLTAIQSLIGQNHVWVDNADSVTLEYWGH